ncbi:MAG: hypothetical protein AB7S92_12840 [Parvibaculaceae bacterium]
MKSYQLHSAVDRHAEFARLDPAVWREEDLLRMWVVADPALIVQLLRSPLTAISDLNEVLAAVKARHPIELPHVEYACGVLPVLVRGDVHPQIRKGFATFLAARLGELDAQLPVLVKSGLAPLGRKGSLDIVTQVVNPLMRKIFSIFLGSEMPEEFLRVHVTEILSFKAMVSHLKALDARIGTVLAHLRATSPDADEVGWKLICLVFGLDSVAMMLTESLVMALRRGEAALPDFPLETGVPVSHRRAKSDFSLGGHAFARGDLIRLQMQSLSYRDMAEHGKFIFGAGAHSCLGKQVSLRIWEAFKREFDTLGAKGRVVDYRLTPSHYIIFHKSVQVEVL